MPKIFLKEKELKVLNNLVVAYFDLAELVKSVFLSTCFVLKKVFLALNQKVETGIHRKRRNGDSSRIMRKPYLYWVWEDLNRLLDNMGRHKLTIRFFNFR